MWQFSKWHFKVILVFVIFASCVLTEQDGTSLKTKRSILKQKFSSIKATKGQYPFLAAFFNATYNNFFCGGSLISRKHILSSKFVQLHVPKIV